jgi:hypothetical protein
MPSCATAVNSLAVIASVQKQLKEQQENTNQAKADVPDSLQLQPAMRDANLNDAVVSNKRTLISVL